MNSNTLDSSFISFLDGSANETNVHLREVLEWASEGILCMNAKGETVFANDSLFKILGYSSKPSMDGFSMFDFCYDEENKRKALNKLELRKKGVADTYSLKIRRVGGDEAFVDIKGRPIFNSRSEFAGTVSFVTDITKQKQLEEDIIATTESLEAKILAKSRQFIEANEKLNQEIKERKLTELSLRTSEKRFKDIFSNSPDAIYVENFEGVILDVNEASCHLHQMSRDEMIGKTIYDLSPPDAHAAIAARQPSIQSGELKSFESEGISTDGKIIPIEIRAAVIEYQGNPALLMHVRDISDRKKNQLLLEQINVALERKVRERTKALELTNEALQFQSKIREQFKKELELQKNFLRQIIDASPAMIFVKDAEGRFLLANEKVARFYGTTPALMEGQTDSENNFTPDELAAFETEDKEVLSKGTELVFPERSYVNIVTGQTVWLQTVKKPVPAFDSEGTNILGVSTDITQIRETKESLKISEYLYRQIATNIPNAALFIYDRNMKYLLAEGALVGIISKPKEEVEGKTVSEVTRNVEAVTKTYESVLKGIPSTQEEQFFDKSLMVHHLPIKDDDGKVIYGMVMIFDITYMKKIQVELETQTKELKRSNEELERFAYVASHDLQGPLRTIASYLQLFESKYKGHIDKQADEFINFSVSGAKRMQTLIHDLLNYSKITSKPKPFRKTNTKDLVNAVLQSLRSTIETKHANVEVGELPTIIAESSQLTQLFQNLIDNAMKFGNTESPVVKINAIEQTAFWEFTVKDNGIGIRDEFKERIFEIFQRLHTDAEYPGTGIGLAICKKIVNLHNGSIWVESKVGEGTTFHFTISKLLKQE
jgi:PAS domain S-box-containing protein